jgi:hypothetical protein
VKPADATARKLLRWYPRAWRERYGEEFLAMIEDSLDGGRPTARLRLSVARAGVRERGHQVRLAGQKTAVRAGRALGGSPGMAFIAASTFTTLPIDLKMAPPSRVGQADAVLYVLAGLVVVTGALIAARGLAALPAFVRFLRAGGWPKIRRRVAWAAGVTVAAGGGLAWLVVLARSHTYAQLNVSSAYGCGEVLTLLAVMFAIGLWARAVKATARRLDLTPRVRAAEKKLGAVTAPAIYVMVGVNLIWSASIESSVPLLLLGTALIAFRGFVLIRRRKGAAGPGRHVRGASGSSGSSGSSGPGLLSG